MSTQAVLASEVPAQTPPPKLKKKLVRRLGKDRSQMIRRTVQMLFVALNVWICVQFYMFVRFCETAGATREVTRPAGVEGWLPIASLMNLKVVLATGEIPSVHPAGLFLLVAFLGISLLMRKAFCSWLCPVGTLSEYIWKLGRKLLGRNFKLPRAVDIPLRGLKYILLGFFLYAVANMSVEATRMFLEGPYGIVADVRMMNFFRYLTDIGALVLLILVAASLFVQNFWCRYLCPYGALMGLASLLSPVRIRREEAPCIDCAKCAKACPSLLPVDKLVTIKSAECTACMECVAVCPAEGALQLSAPAKRQVPAWAVAAVSAALFLGLVGYAKAIGKWDTNIPQQVYFDLVPRAQDFEHPR